MSPDQRLRYIKGALARGENLGGHADWLVRELERQASKANRLDTQILEIRNATTNVEDAFEGRPFVRALQSLKFQSRHRCHRPLKLGTIIGVPL